MLLIHGYVQHELCPAMEEAGGKDEKTDQFRQGGHTI